MRAFRRFGSFEGTGFVPWVKRIVLNLQRNEVRRRRRRPSVPFDEGEEDRVVCAEPLADVLLERSSIDPRVMRALDEIAAPFARAVMLVDLAGLSYAQAAEEEGVPEGTIRSRLSRGREALRPLLRSYADREYGIG